MEVVAEVATHHEVRSVVSPCIAQSCEGARDGPWNLLLAIEVGCLAGLVTDVWQHQKIQKVGRLNMIPKQHLEEWHILQISSNQHCTKRYM